MSGAQELPISPDLTPREAARRLATSEVTIWSMIADGRLPSYSLSPKRGAARRIRWEAVEAIRRGADPVEAVRQADQFVAHRLELPVTPIKPKIKLELAGEHATPNTSFAGKTPNGRNS